MSLVMNNRSTIEYLHSIGPAFESFCQPLKEYFGISLFIYFKAYKNDKYLLLSNDATFNINYINKINSANIFYRDYLNCKSLYDCILWPIHPQNLSMNIYLEHGYWHGLSILLEKSDEHVEMVCFLADKNNHNITEFYYKHIEVLEKFTNQFKKTFSKELEAFHQDDDRLAIFSRKLDLFIPNKELLKDHEVIDSFYKAIGLSDDQLYSQLNLSILTPMELKILKFACMGYSAKYIAKELKIAPKTVEVHIHNIKQKTGLHCKNGLIQMYHDFF